MFRYNVFVSSDVPLLQVLCVHLCAPQLFTRKGTHQRLEPSRPPAAARSEAGGGGGEEERDTGAREGRGREGGPQSGGPSRPLRRRGEGRGTRQRRGRFSFKAAATQKLFLAHCLSPPVGLLAATLVLLNPCETKAVTYLDRTWRGQWVALVLNNRLL